MITIVDYGAGNIGSIENMIKRCGGKSLITSCPVEIDKAKKLIIPGVGSFDFGMNKLKENGLIEILNKKVIKEKIPVLGICLGMQLMTLESEEGEELGLGWINAKVKKFQSEDSNNRIPHMGWNLICLKKDSIIFGDLDLNVPDRKFYFVHSYYVNSYDSTEVVATTKYINNFTSVVEKDNIIGMQFHPEKSHKFGMEVIKNFINL